MKHPAILLCALTLCSCSVYRPKAMPPTAFYGKAVKAELSSADWLSKFNALPEATPADLAYKAQERNRLLNESIWLVDSSYANFENQFYGLRAAEDIGGDFIQLGLTGAATLTGAAGTKTILALIATTATGAKASIDSHLYDQLSRGPIVNQMRASRATALIPIQQGMLAPLSEYSLDQGLRDVQDYYASGTVVGALQAMVITAGQQSTAAREQLRLLRQERREVR